jgi:predicted transcriptional regulator of viral defense system
MVAERIQTILPGMRLVSRRKKTPNRRQADLYLKDRNGRDYYLEVKAGDCTRIDIGRAIEYKAQLSKTSPRTQLILVCRNISKEIKKTLEGAGIKAMDFEDLGLSGDILDRKPKASKNLSPIEERAYFGLLRKGDSFVSTSELASLLGISRLYSMKLLASLNKKGVIFRVGRGRYIVIPADVIYERKGFVADPVMVVSQLLSGDYYVAYQSAANLHGLAEQLPFVTTVAIPYRKRTIPVGTSRLQFVTVKKDRFSWGIEERNYGSALVKASDIHKTIIDCVDRSDLCGGFSEVVRILSNAVDQPQFDGDKLVDYAKRFGNRAVMQRLGFTLERTRNKKTYGAIRSLDRMKSDFTYLLDPRLSRVGRLSEKWHIVENTSVKRPAPQPKNSQSPLKISMPPWSKSLHESKSSIKSSRSSVTL